MKTTHGLSQTDLSILRQVRAYNPDGHFELSQTAHTTDSFLPGAFEKMPSQAAVLAKQLALPFLEHKPDVIVAHPRDPAGYLVQRIAGKLYILSCVRPSIPVLDPELLDYVKPPKGSLPSHNGEGMNLLKNKRVLVFQGLFVFPTNICSLLSSITALGGEVVGVAALCSRSEVRLEDAELGITTYSRFHLPIKKFSISECPYCLRNRPFTPLGK